jgi:hypothetical protein
VLHIATVHYGSPRWIEIQSRHLREHISVPYLTWASLEQIDPSYSSHFDRVVGQVGSHSDKLNHLAIEITAEASEDDVLMFLDGDAFPIADPMPLIADGLAKAPLLAVRRVENSGDPQPHPCFCVTTVSAWRKLGGDWSQGYNWVNTAGERVSDVGGNLLRRLELTNTPWVEVLRSNRKNLDPIFFGIYGDTVYHHGAGFRGFSHLTRLHLALAPKSRPLPPIPVLRGAVRLRDRQRQHVWYRNTKERLAQRSEAVIAKIQRGDEEWLADFI